MYKEARRLGLRFQTTKGNLSVEQLWSLSIDDLDTLVVSLDEAYKNSKISKSFIKKRTTADKKIKLQFDIALDVLNTMQEEVETIKEAREIKEHNSKIINLIAEKKDSELAGKSIKDLEKMLR